LGRIEEEGCKKKKRLREKGNKGLQLHLPRNSGDWERKRLVLKRKNSSHLREQRSKTRGYKIRY